MSTARWSRGLLVAKMEVLLNCSGDEDYDPGRGPEMAHGFPPWFWALERAPIPCRTPSVRLHGVRARLRAVPLASRLQRPFVLVGL